jgi:streptogramin lyase
MLTYRRLSTSRLFALVFALVAGLAIALGAMLSAAQAAPFASLKQFRVPTDNSQPRSITNGSDGNLWFTEGTEFVPSQIGRITPAGDITEFGPACAFCIVTDIIQGPGDVLYYTSNDPILGRITTDGEILDPIAMPESDALGGNLAVNGNEIWITDFNNDSLWRYDVGSGQFTQFSVPEPADAVVDGAGIVWFTAPLEPGIGRLQSRPAAYHHRRRPGHLVYCALHPAGGRATGPGARDGDWGGDRVPTSQRRPPGHRGVARRHGLVHPDHQGQHRPDQGSW